MSSHRNSTAKDSQNRQKSFWPSFFFYFEIPKFLLKFDIVENQVKINDKFDKKVICKMFVIQNKVKLIFLSKKKKGKQKNKSKLNCK